MSKKPISVHDIRRIDFGSKVAEFGVDSSHGAIMARRQVPILCYHQIRDFRPSDSKRSRDYIVPPALFNEQMKMLADSGYKVVLPDQLIQYFKTGQGIPDKPVMVSFDDADLSQFEVAKPVLDQYGFKAAFQLSAKRDSFQPLYTIRRIIVPGEWSTGRVYQFMKGSFR